MSMSFKKQSTQMLSAKHILIFDFHRIGDMIYLTPMLKMLRKKFPTAKISLVAGPCASAVLKNNQGLLDEIIHFEAPWVKYDYGIRSLSRCLKLIKQLRETKWNIGIDVRGDFRQILMLYFTKAKRRISYDFTGGEFLLTDIVPYDPEKIKHLVERDYTIVEYLTNSEIEDKSVELWLSDEEIKWRDDYFRLHGIKDNELTIGIHPGANSPLRKWNQEKIVKLIHRILGKYLEFNVKILLFFGTNETSERELFEKEFNQSLSVIPISESLREYIVLISGLDLFIGMDSSGGHIASAFNVPSLVLFGPQIAELGKPYTENCEVIIKDGFDCRPCNQKNCNKPIGSRCMDAIEVEEVLEAVDRVLTQKHLKHSNQ